MPISMPKEVVFIFGAPGAYLQWYRRKMRGQEMAATPPPMVAPQQALPVVPVSPAPVHLADVKTARLTILPEVQAHVTSVLRPASTILVRATPETDPQQERVPVAVAVLPGMRARTVYANYAAQPAELVQEGILKFAQQHPGCQVDRVCLSDFNIDILRLHNLVPFGPIRVESWSRCEDYEPHHSVVLLYGPEPKA